MVTNARLLPVSPPTFQTVNNGLFAVADMRSSGDAHWQLGVTWENVCGGNAGGTTWIDCGTSSPWASGTPAAKAANATRSWWGATPFTVTAEVDCSPPDFYERAEQIAGDALSKVEAWQVENAFWTGTAGGVANAVYPHLAANTPLKDGMVNLQLAATQVTGVALNITDAIGNIEGALAKCYGGVGVIHVPAALAPSMAAQGLLVKDGPRFRTHGGNLVAIGNGYPGTGPDASTPGLTKGWIYGTGGVFIYRSAPRLLPAMGASGSYVTRSTNTVKAIAERTYVVGYDCCLVAALVTSISFITTWTGG